MEAYVRADLWDIEQQGVTAFLECIRGELGFTHVTAPLLIGATTRLRLHPFASPRWLDTRGGLCFQPESRQFLATRLRPVTADWLRSRDPLAELAEVAARTHVGLAAELRCREGVAAVARPGQAAQKNCFGEPIEGRACLNNSDVREFLTAVVAEVAGRYAIRSIVLSDLLTEARNETRRPDLSSPVPLDPLAAWLLEQCFCESCRQQMSTAGLDAAYLARRTSSLLEKAFNSGSTGLGGTEELLSEDQHVRAYDTWRHTQLYDWLRAIARRCDAALTLQLGGAGPSGPMVPSDLGLNWACSCGAQTADQGLAALASLAERFRPSSLRACFSASPAALPDAPTLVRVVTRAAELGVGGVQIGDYGTTPPARLDWLRQALRGAARAATQNP